MRNIALIVAVLLLPRCATGGEPGLDGDALRTALAAALDIHATARRTTVYLKVVDVETGKVLFDRGGDRLLTPASNLKIYTTACALDLFGPEHRFKTVVRAEGPIEDGVLRGKLVLVGGGDSMLSSEQLAELADRVVAEWGLRRIEGGVRVDNSRYSPQVRGPGWMWDDDPEPYNMPVTPLMVDFNVLEVRLRGGTGENVAELALPSAYPPLVVDVDHFDPKKPRVERTPFTDVVKVVSGPPLEEPIVEKLTPHHAEAWIAGVFAEMLKDRGVEFGAIEGDASSDGGSDAAADREITHEGPTLLATLEHFNRVSENAVGEVLLHEIAIARGVKQPGWREGARATSRWLRDVAGLERGAFRLVDGSGLSRYNQISAASAVELLRFMNGHKYGEEFKSVLPAVGRDGKDEKDTVDAARPLLIHAKGGSMTGVSTMSGYVETEVGRTLAFSLLANGFLGDNKPVFDLRAQVFPLLARYRAAKSTNRGLAPRG